MKYYEIIIHADLPITGKYLQVKDLKLIFMKQELLNLVQYANRIKKEWAAVAFFFFKVD